LDNSSVSNLLNEQFSFKINYLLELKEISKYVQTKEILINLLKKCDFLKISTDSEIATYDLPERIIVFSILNIPPKMNKKRGRKKY
jgi:hypothetical protein